MKLRLATIVLVLSVLYPTSVMAATQINTRVYISHLASSNMLLAGYFNILREYYANCYEKKAEAYADEIVYYAKLADGERLAYQKSLDEGASATETQSHRNYLVFYRQVLQELEDEKVFIFGESVWLQVEFNPYRLPPTGFYFQIFYSAWELNSFSPEWIELLERDNRDLTSKLKIILARKDTVEACLMNTPAEEGTNIKEMDLNE